MQPLWLCLRLPSLPLDALALSGASPAVVFERRRSRRVLVAANPAAEALGLWPGLELGQVAALAPDAACVERNLRAERELLRALAGAAYAFSSQVTTQAAAPAPADGALWLEVAHSLELFGGLDALTARLAPAIAALGCRAAIGIAPTPEGAFLLAGLASAAPVRNRESLWHALAPLPVSTLPVDEDTRIALAGSGLATLGAVLALPLDALALRFSPAFSDWLGRLTGRLPDARRLYRPPDHYRRKLDLAGDFDSSEALRFPIRRLLAELAAHLVARDAGVPAFTIELEHESGAPTRLDVRLASPSRDPVHLQVLAQTQLERLAVRAPVEALTLRAAQFLPVRVRQFDLFNPRTREEDEWQSVLDRLRARLGVAAVQGLGLHADHRPEKAWTPGPGQEASKGSLAALGMTRSGKRRPLWLLPEPRALNDAPAQLQGPERIEGGWWDGADVRRDYYVAETGEGARLWVYREHLSGRWFLHGLWA
ncbi:MAG TPA: DNA polymerase Y family protein [Verrucomicrobiae bacterium]|nr:DNA polymerase Y family protein [Verrucomicrobiae bacterium]